MTVDETDRTPRCTEPGCPVRYHVGADRPCGYHRADDTSVDLTTRTSGFGVSMRAFDGGDGDGHGDGGQAAGGGG